MLCFGRIYWSSAQITKTNRSLRFAAVSTSFTNPTSALRCLAICNRRSICASAKASLYESNRAFHISTCERCWKMTHLLGLCPKILNLFDNALLAFWQIGNILSPIEIKRILPRLLDQLNHLRCTSRLQARLPNLLGNQSRSSVSMR